MGSGSDPGGTVKVFDSAEGGIPLRGRAAAYPSRNCRLSADIAGYLVGLGKKRTAPASEKGEGVVFEVGSEGVGEGE